MSVRVMSQIWEHAPVESGELLVLLAIADHCDDQGRNAWPSVETLARKARLSTRRVQQILRSLENRSLIHIEENRGGTLDTPSDRRPNRYTIMLDVLTSNSGVKPTSPQDVVVQTPDVVVLPQDLVTDVSGTGVKPASQRGEAHFAHGVKPTSPEPSIEPSIESKELPQPSAAVTAQTIVAAYVDSWTALHGEPPIARQLGQLAREARVLLASGSNSERLIKAAEKCASDGHARLDSAYAWITASATRSTGARDSNLQAGLSLAARYAAEENQAPALEWGIAQ